MRVLVTGAAGFVGAEVALRLVERGDEVLGVDCLTPYYDVSLKKARLSRLEGKPGFQFEGLDVADAPAFRRLYAGWKPARVIHLAAQPGVRYSLSHPEAYLHANLTGFLSVLEACRHEGTEHLIYASSSSVYGGSRCMPYSEKQSVDHPVSLYAATKKSNELMAHAYSHLYRLPTTGLRFFTVYGPWGRPDMSPFLFADKILKGERLSLFHYGKHKRDFTFIDDIAEGVVRVLDKPAVPNLDWSPLAPDASSSTAPYRLYNIGNHAPVEILHFVSLLEKALGRKAETELLPMQPGDVEDTFANVDGLKRDFDFTPRVSISEGVERFVRWYREFYRR